jgi:hypothetical protein
MSVNPQSFVSHGEEPSVQGASAGHNLRQASSEKHNFIIGDEGCLIRNILPNQWFKIPLFRKVPIGFLKKLHINHREDLEMSHCRQS